MFESLSDRLTGALSGLRGKGRLSDADIDATAREIRLALLEADVALPVVKDFIDKVRVRAVGEDVIRSVRPGQQVIKIVYDALVDMLGAEEEESHLRVDVPPAGPGSEPAPIAWSTRDPTNALPDDAGVSPSGCKLCSPVGSRCVTCAWLDVSGSRFAGALASSTPRSPS